MPKYPDRKAPMIRVTSSMSRVWSWFSAPTPEQGPCHIHRLPIEVLTLIFAIYTHSDDEERKDRSSDANTEDGDTEPRPQQRYGRVGIREGSLRNPIFLTHVCSKWRTLAISNPSLWSTICVVDPRARDIAIFETWLDRSQDDPLDLSILQRRCPRDPKQRGPKYTEHGTQSIVQKAVFECHRWKRVTLALHFTTNLTKRHFKVAARQLDRKTKRPPLPTLERFTLDGFIRRWDEEARVALLRLLYSSPKLHSIRFTPCTWHHTDDKDEMQRIDILHAAPLARLGRVEVDVAYVSQLIWYLSQPSCPKEVMVQGLLDDEERDKKQLPKMDHPLEIPHLESLEIRDAEILAPVFNALTMPNLKHLQLPVCNQEFGELNASFSAFLARSKCTLTSLHVVSLLQNRLVDLLKLPSLSNLTELRIDSKVSSFMLNALTHSSRGEKLLPQLSKLHLQHCNTNEKDMVRMLGSRKRRIGLVTGGLHWSVEPKTIEDVPGTVQAYTWTRECRICVLGRT
ncbi:hypothetical protein BKA70DRAFT_1358490 [Coprinopsis sp. MPI-PUGE-AT-0042]|nr:hypothetical protein BKA70DRAFT_1358490 [Coprinopsis sp. MPI-PUGE-AT-0042]